VTQVNAREGASSLDVAEGEVRLARARQAFEEGLRDASQAGGQVLRRVVVPAVWGAALLGGALAILLLVRFARRRSPPLAVLRVVIEQRPAAAPILPAIGGALARFAIERMLAGAHETVPNNYAGSEPGADADGPSPSRVYQEHGRGDPGAPSRPHADSVVASMASNGGFDSIG
jgi:hypothetical protein